MPGVFFLVFVRDGVLSYRCCIVFSLPSLVLSLIVMTPPVWPLTLWFGPLVLPRRRRVVDAVRNAALLPGPANIWESGWVGFLPSVVTADDVRIWP